MDAAQRAWRETTEKPDTEVKSPALKDGLYDIAVDVMLTINWLNPPNGMMDEAEREHKQNILNYKAYKLKREIEKLVKEAGI